MIEKERRNLLDLVEGKSKMVPKHQRQSNDEHEEVQKKEWPKVV
jgi:hypothetical protein